MLSLAATEDINRWMNLGVAIMPGGSILQGSYDGYGNLDAFAAVVGDATVWHQACWRAAGSPMDYRGPSAPSPDQGWFFEDGAHDLAQPGTGRR